jgi:hypoxanthine-DNA glycosylase
MLHNQSSERQTPNVVSSLPLHIFLTGQPAVGKTTIIKHILQDLNQSSSINTNISIRGFYTEECRQEEQEEQEYSGDNQQKNINSKQGGNAAASATTKGGRIGFDIVYYLEDNGSEDRPQVPKRQPLSRLSKTSISKKSAPHVGNYLVNIENVENYAVASLLSHQDVNSHSTCSCQRNELVVVDEVGKMEMLCPSFIPAVNRLLDEFSSRNHGDVCVDSNYKTRRMVLGTLPTPRYGRVIPAVENIKMRHDVMVLHVTKANRDELKRILRDVIVEKWFFAQQEEGQEWDTVNGCLSNTVVSRESIQQCLAPFLYHKKGEDTTVKTALHMDSSGDNGVVDHSTTNVIPCKPLYQKIMTTSTATAITPKVLVLGETASPEPSNKDYSYCDRSMWTIFGHIFGIEYRPIKNIHAATKDDLETYIRLKDKVMAKGICIWDVFATVHDTHKTNRKAKRQKVPKQGQQSETNKIIELLQKHPSIQKIIFIGKKAHASFIRHFSPLPDSVNVSLVTVPSSSPANSKMTMDEKVKEWNKALQEL